MTTNARTISPVFGRRYVRDVICCDRLLYDVGVMPVLHRYEADLVSSQLPGALAAIALATSDQR